MVNWDPEAKTNISDEEVIFKEQNGKLYFLNIKLKVQKNSFSGYNTS
jgi:valyl-tRNA synthetase